METEVRLICAMNAPEFVRAGELTEFALAFVGAWLFVLVGFCVGIHVLMWML